MQALKQLGSASFSDRAVVSGKQAWQHRCPRDHRRQSSRAMGASTAAPAKTSPVWTQTTVRLKARPRGCHVVTRELLKDVDFGGCSTGLANFFIQHTSASLTVNENCSGDVPLDLNDALDRLAPESSTLYRHLDEGLDDMPAHVKSSLMGPSLTIPVQQGRLALGTWQGIYLNEHRDSGGSRKVVVTVNGVQ